MYLKMVLQLQKLHWTHNLHLIKPLEMAFVRLKILEIKLHLGHWMGRFIGQLAMQLGHPVRQMARTCPSLENLCGGGNAWSFWIWNQSCLLLPILFLSRLRLLPGSLWALLTLMASASQMVGCTSSPSQQPSRRIERQNHYAAQDQWFLECLHSQCVILPVKDCKQGM